MYSSSSMFAKSSEEGIFKYLCISAYSLFICKAKGKLVLEKFTHIFSKCNSAHHYFSKCNSAHHYFSKCNSAHHYFSRVWSQRALFFLSMSQRAIEFSFQKHYSAIASMSWYEAHIFLICFDYSCYLICTKLLGFDR